MDVLTRENILEIQDIQIELVQIPEWGEDATVYVKGMTGAERDKFESSLVVLRGKSQTLNMANIRAKLASLTICDENGKRLFGEQDVQVLSQKSASALQRVFVLAQKLSRIGDEDIEELAEGLKADPFDGSPSA